MNAKQLKTVAQFEARAAQLGHEFQAYPDGYMVAQNPWGERMAWQVEPDGAALMVDPQSPRAVLQSVVHPLN